MVSTSPGGLAHLNEAQKYLGRCLSPLLTIRHLGVAW
jgi:hypothetical protein